MVTTSTSTRRSAYRTGRPRAPGLPTRQGIVVDDVARGRVPASRLTTGSWCGRPLALNDCALASLRGGGVGYVQRAADAGDEVGDLDGPGPVKGSGQGNVGRRQVADTKLRQ